MKDISKITRIYIAAFSLMFLLGPLVKLDDYVDVSESATILINLLVFGAFIAGMSCWALATHIEGIKGFFKGFAAIFFGFADSSVLHSAYKSIPNQTYIGAIVVIMLLAVLHWWIIEKWFLVKPNKN